MVIGYYLGISLGESSDASNSFCRLGIGYFSPLAARQRELGMVHMSQAFLEYHTWQNSRG